MRVMWRRLKNLRRRRAFSLIELLIVIAIIAALVGVAVPFFQDNLKDAQQTKAKQDLDVIKNAIARYDAENPPLRGTSLKPLLGRYLQQLPKDPWGNDYLLDANIGIILTYGADGVCGGEGTDEDIAVYYKPQLTIRRCQYAGQWGVPNTGYKFIITMTKPFTIVNNANFLTAVQLLRDIKNTTDGNPLDFNDGGNWGSTWSVVTTVAGVTTAPAKGKVAFECNNPAITSSDQSVTPTMAINFDFSIPGSSYGIEEVAVDGGPLTTSIYGPDADHWKRDATCVPRLDLGGGNYVNQGIKIEKY